MQLSLRGAYRKFVMCIEYRYLQDKYAILSQKGLAAAEEIVHVFVPNTFDHLAEPSIHFRACISSLVIYFSHMYQETKSSRYVTYSSIHTAGNQQNLYIQLVVPSTNQEMILSYLRRVGI